jgi:hypothetical protein
MLVGQPLDRVQMQEIQDVLTELLEFEAYFLSTILIANHFANHFKDRQRSDFLAKSAKS